MLPQQERQITLSPELSSKEEHNSQKEGKKISSANFALEEIFLWIDEIKEILLQPFLDSQYNEEPRERHPAFFSL